MAADFELVSSFEVLGDIPVKKYRSKRTGIQCCFAQVRGPLVNGFLCLATEAHDDDGLPHTLEHLVFMGSEQYPYKGLLDLLANRCLAQGTNAWTATDHTCYTIETAGSEGFVNLLPIYLDHVLYPTLTESGYITEVQHVNGEGEDAGVVYCEMQARENSGSSRTHLALLRNLYPGHCGLKSETGGIMENLRTSCSHKKVCDYHQQFYRPDNLCMIITGQVDPGKVFEAIKPFEDRILTKGALPPYVRPWQDPVPPLPSNNTDVTVPFPTEDESSGMVLVGCRGPASNDRRHMASMQIILEYLTDSSIAPLQKTLVEIPEPYCSDVGYQMIEHSECCTYIKAMDVPSDKLATTRDKIIEVIRDIAEGREAIDMSRMASVIHRVLLDTKDKIENNPHDTFADLVIYDFLYSHSGGDLETRADFISELKSLGKEAVDFWMEFLKKYFISASLVTVIGEPSKQLMDEMAATEKARIAAQLEALGEEGLKDKEKRLNTANDDNEKAPPPGVVSSIAVPSTASILFHPLSTLSNRRPVSAQSSSDSNATAFHVAEIPYAFQLDHVTTMFVKMTALLDTSVLSEELKPYLNLYLEIIFESPVLRNGVIIPHEEVVAQLAADTLDQTSCVGVRGSRFNAGDFDELAYISLKLEAEKYTKGVGWLHEILYKTQMTKERLDIVAKKMINEVASMKRNGRVVTRALLKNIIFSKRCNHYTTNMVRQHAFLTKLTEQLATNPQEVISKMEALRTALTSSSNLRIHVTADVTKLPTNPHEVWKTSFLEDSSAAVPKSLPVVQRPSAFVAKPVIHGKIVGVGSVESSFLLQATPCIDKFEHPDLAAIMVYLECLTTLEGPIWRQVRGLGLSYHYSMRVDPCSGMLYFILARSTHLVKAYAKTKDIVDGYLSGETLIEPGELEAAISSVIFGVINREQSVSSVARESMLSEFRDVGPGYNRDLLDKVSRVTMDDLERVGQRYLAPLFDPMTSWCAVCCNPSKVDEVKNGLKSLNKDLIVVPSLDEEFTWS